MLPQVIGFQRGKAAHDDQMRDRVQQRDQGNSRHGDNSQRFSAKRHQRLDIRRQECALTVVAPARLDAKMQKGIMGQAKNILREIFFSVN